MESVILNKQKANNLFGTTIDFHLVSSPGSIVRSFQRFLAISPAKSLFFLKNLDYFLLQPSSDSYFNFFIISIQQIKNQALSLQMIISIRLQN